MQISIHHHGLMDSLSLTPQVETKTILTFVAARASTGSRSCCTFFPLVFSDSGSEVDLSPNYYIIYIVFTLDCFGHLFSRKTVLTKTSMVLKV